MDSNLIANFGQQNGFKFDCKFCDLKFSSTNDLRKHTAAQHDGYKNSCIPCQRTFVNSYSLKRHQINYCCDSNFSATDDVFNLRSSKKQNEIWHVCLLCQHKFSNKYSLRRHQRTMHEGRLGCWCEESPLPPPVWQGQQLIRKLSGLSQTAKVFSL